VPQSTIRELSCARRVLLVDDQPDSAELLGMLLEDRGHEVRIAHTGEDALSAVRDFRPQVALLDIDLPGMTGHELGRILKATPETAACRLIALSGHGEERHRLESALAGFEAHFTKPVDTDVLFATIVDGVREVSARAVNRS
jgi:CheY-like chemotaxis protein